MLTIDKTAGFSDDKMVNLSDLPSILRAQNTDTTHEVIYLRADEKVPFGAFATLMDAVKQAGITNVSIVTQPAENPTPTKYTARHKLDRQSCPLEYIRKHGSLRQGL